MSWQYARLAARWVVALVRRNCHVGPTAGLGRIVPEMSLFGGGSGAAWPKVSCSDQRDLGGRGAGESGSGGLGVEEPDVGESDADLIDEIALLERIKAAVVGCQLSEVVRFATGQVAEQLARDVHPRLLTCQADPQGVAALAALQQAADMCVAAGDSRSRGQIMADTLVARVTGQASADDVNVEVGRVMPLNTLLDPHSTEPADLHGYGPIPAPIARWLLHAGRGRCSGVACSPTRSVIWSEWTGGGDGSTRR